MEKDIFTERRRMLADMILNNELYVPMKAKEIAILLDIPKEQRGELQEVLDSLVSDGTIGVSKKGKYMKPDNVALTGIFESTGKGFGFVVIPDREDDIFVKANDTMNAFYHDKVKVVITSEKTKGKRAEGRRREIPDFIGAFVIMDMVVRVSDGSLVNVEIQKVPYMFPAQRISCYSSDLVMRQYRRESERLRHENKGMSYKNLKKVYTIVFYENSDKNLISPVDGRMYFHEGKTAFNTGIKMNLLQEYKLISLDTFKKYRYSSIINGNTDITEYDIDESEYEHPVTEDVKRARVKYMSLFVTEDVEDMKKLLEVFPELSDIVHDMGVYMEDLGNTFDTFSEALRILDRNTADLMVDEYRKEVERAKAELAEAKAEAEEKIKAGEQEIKRLKEELARLRKE